MSLEDDLRAALRDDPAAAPTGGGLDARAAIADARRRRRPRVAIATGATALAGVGILAIAMPLVLQPIGVASTSGGAPMSDQVQMTESSDAGLADRSGPTCGALWATPAIEVVAGADLELTVSDPTSTADGVGGTVSIMNRSTGPVEVRSAMVDVVVLDGDVVAGLPSAGSVEMIGAPIPLAPGESAEIGFVAVVESCGAIGDPAASAPALAGAVLVTTGSPTGAVETAWEGFILPLVTSPAPD